MQGEQLVEMGYGSQFSDVEGYFTEPEFDYDTQSLEVDYDSQNSELDYDSL
ncbi:2527_t:CDS:2, partial [Dentiscutata erythropus]